MGFTTPGTAVAGTALTASWLNTYVRDNIAWTSTDSPCCRVYNNAAFAHNSSGNFLAVTMNSERFDNAAMHDTGSNTSRITIPAASGGKYIVGAGLKWAASAAGTERTSTIRLNGTTTRLIDSTLPPNASINVSSPLATVYALVAADYIEAFGYQDSAGTTNVVSVANSTPEFWAYWYRV